MGKDIKVFLSGILVGVSNAIPGVSGGTMAVVLNIYDKLLNALSLKGWRENKRFLTLFLVGVGAGIIGLSKIILSMRQSYPMALGFIFLGLIVGSIPLIYRNGCQGEKPKLYNVGLAIVMFLSMAVLSFVNQDGLHNKGIDDIGSVDYKMFLLIVLSGIIAAIAMIIPGISGSLVMLLIGTYNIVIESIGEFKLSILIPMSIGTLIGLVMGIQGIKKALALFPQAMYFSILGLVLGSVFFVYPGWENSMEGYVSIFLFIGFAATAYISSRNE